MGKLSKFIIITHSAEKAGLHHDLRVKNLSHNNGGWDSFAVPNMVPTERGKKVLAIKTPIHSEEDALFTGRIPSGSYGGGILKKYDEGDCVIEKYTEKHIVINFKGKKVSGIYHLINMGTFTTGGRKQKQYILFKGALKSE